MRWPLQVLNRLQDGRVAKAQDIPSLSVGLGRRGWNPAGFRLLLGLMAFLTVPSAVQGSQGNSVRTTPSAPEGREARQELSTPRVLGTAQSEDEFQAYRDLFGPLTPQQVVSVAGSFLKTYPHSGLTPYVHQTAVTAYRQLNEVNKVIVHAEAALVDLPQNPVILTMLAQAYVDAQGPEEAIDRAEAALRCAGEQLTLALVGEHGSTQISELKADNYAILGMAYLMRLHQGKDDLPMDVGLAKVVENLVMAVKLNPAHTDASYYLALAYALQSDDEKSLRYYARAAALGGQTAEKARTDLGRLYRKLGKSGPGGITKLIARARKDIQTELARIRAHPSGSRREPSSAIHSLREGR